MHLCTMACDITQLQLPRKKRRCDKPYCWPPHFVFKWPSNGHWHFSMRGNKYITTLDGFYGSGPKWNKKICSSYISKVFTTIMLKCYTLNYNACYERQWWHYPVEIQLVDLVFRMLRKTWSCEWCCWGITLIDSNPDWNFHNFCYSLCHLPSRILLRY